MGRVSRAVGPLLVATLLFGVVACGSSAAKTTTSRATGAASSGGAGLTIRNFGFQPNPLQAKVGDTITVTNLDNTNHTATADDKSFDTGQFASGTRTFKVAKAGTFSYHCNVHDYMHGTIQVQN